MQEQLRNVHSSQTLELATRIVEEAIATGRSRARHGHADQTDSPPAWHSTDDAFESGDGDRLHQGRNGKVETGGQDHRHKTGMMPMMPLQPETECIVRTRFSFLPDPSIRTIQVQY